MFELQYVDIQKKKEYEEIIEKVVEECFKIENLTDSKMYINIILTTPNNIKEYNKKFRNIDKETDVLSFPMFEKYELDEKIKKDGFKTVDILGDMIISIPKVEEQAVEYGHSFERELAYMVVHSFYHLLGFDHMTEEDKAIMREKEETILNKLQITRI